MCLFIFVFVLLSFLFSISVVCFFERKMNENTKKINTVMEEFYDKLVQGFEGVPDKSGFVTFALQQSLLTLWASVTFDLRVWCLVNPYTVLSIKEILCFYVLAPHIVKSLKLSLQRCEFQARKNS